MFDPSLSWSNDHFQHEMAQKMMRFLTRKAVSSPSNQSCEPHVRRVCACAQGRQQEQQQQQQRERQRVRLESISPFASRQKGGKLRPGSAPSGPHGAPPTASASAPSLHPPARPRTAGPTRADGVSISPPASPASKSKLYRSQAVLTWQAKHAYPRISVR
jgi:hypothetical protein